MTPMQQLIYERLTQAFTPTLLEVIDDSEKHKGHVGSQNGAGHYTVKIQAESFKGRSRVAVHREIYQVLDDLIPLKIHALALRVRSG